MKDLINDNITWYKNRIPKQKPLTREEEYKLIKEAQARDEEATRFLIENNQGLIISIASLFPSSTAMEMIDLVQEGNIGLLTAIKKFQFEKNVKFSSYGYYWIKQTISRKSKETARTIKLPETVYADSKEYEEVWSELKIALHRNPTEEEIIEKSNLSKYRISIVKQLHTPIMSLNKMKLKYDTNEGWNESSDEAIECIESPYDINVEITNSNLKEDILKMLDHTDLSDRSKEMIKLHNGIDNDTDMSYDEIAKLYNISSQRVHQIVSNSLNKIRNSDDLYNLALYLPESNMGYEIINKTEQDTKKLSKKR